ncbi:MAG: EF-hand domain-containing protein [Pseudoalteromonas sp.]
MDRLEELFEFFDTNSDGVISRSELIELVEVLLNEKGIGKSAKVMKEFDIDQNGVIDFYEFKLLCETHLELL